MGLIKDIYSRDFYNTFSGYLDQYLPSFDKKVFIKRIFEGGFENMEWKQRMKHTTTVLHSFLPPDFPKAVALIRQVIAALQTDNHGIDSLAFVIFPDYIEQYGLEDFNTAVPAFEYITRFVSCEFAVRPFIIRYGDRMIKAMIKWSQHKNHKVRRLASEGSRPRLPWAIALPGLKKDPTPILPLLENLKQDPSEWVRKSVANNLNDISRDHPDLVLEIAKRWRGQSKETDAIVKHGCRTLLKQGHTGILSEYGLDSSGIMVEKLRILSPVVRIGAQLEFSFSIRNTNRTTQKVRLEYGLYYQKANGSLSRKVFKISEKDYKAGEVAAISRKQSFQLITTRKFHTGQHKVSILINGEEKAEGLFTLTG